MSVDEELLEPALRAPGEGVLAFDASVDELMPRIHGYFRRRVLDGSDVEDCAIETVAILWRRWGEVPESRQLFDAWVFGIARGVLSNHRRTLTRRQALFRRLTDEHALRIPLPQDDGGNNVVYAALDKLRPIDCELVMLIAWDGLSVQEAGAVVGLAASAARTRYSRARSKLRTILAVEGSEDD